MRVVREVLEHPERVKFLEAACPGAIRARSGEGGEHPFPVRPRAGCAHEEACAIEPWITRAQAGGGESLDTHFQGMQPKTVEEAAMASGGGSVRNRRAQRAAIRGRVEERRWSCGALAGEKPAQRSPPGCARDRGDHGASSGLPSATVTFCPPNPKELESTTSTRARRGRSPITSIGQSGSRSR